jgi:thiamine biosynthesis protein ThiS
VNGKQMDWHKGQTVEEILKNFNFEYPILVKVNGKPVLKKQYSTFEVPDSAEVITVDIIAGG